MLSKKVVIAGGTGEVGAGIAALMYAEGCEVHIISRNQEKIDKLRSEYPDCFFYCIDCSDFEACSSVAEAIGNVDIFISTFGSYIDNENILNYESHFVEKYFKDTLLARFNVLKYFLPKTHSFIDINGNSGWAPKPNHGLVSVTDAAQTMLIKVIAAENPKNKISQLVICERVSDEALKITSVFEAIKELVESKSKMMAIGNEANLLELSD